MIEEPILDWSDLISVLSSNSAIPKTPFIGVLISWLMVARNADFERFADWASSFASISASSAAFLSVISSQVPTSSIADPSLS